jgi:hypothetical protein
MVFVSSPRRRRSVRAGLIAICVIAVGLLTAAPAVSASPPASPGGSVSSPTGGSTVLVSSSGTYAIPVQWSASCPDTSGTQLQFWFWYVHIYVTHQDGSEANFQSVVYVGTEDSGTNNTQGMVVQMAPGLSTETFQVQVSLICGGQEQVIGSPSITLTKCDPDAYDKAQREYETAASLIESGSKDLEEAIKSAGEIDQEVRDEAAKTAIYGVGLSQLLVALEHGAVITPQSALLVESVHAITELIGVAEQAKLKGQDWDRLTRGAAADFAEAGRLAADANQLLSRAFANGCHDPIHDQVKKLLDDQKREDLAREIINSWMHNQNETLYVNPVTHETESVDLALKQVKAELIAGHKEADMAKRVARAGSGGKITAQQIRAALHYLGEARRLNGKLKGQLARIESADQHALKRLRALFG